MCEETKSLNTTPQLETLSEQPETHDDYGNIIRPDLLLNVGELKEMLGGDKISVGTNVCSNVIFNENISTINEIVNQIQKNPNKYDNIRL